MNLLKRILFIAGAALASLANVCRGRSLAINAVLTPGETSRGTQSLDATAAITFKNALVTTGADDRHFKATTLVGDIPIGILLNDEVVADEVDVVKKSIALFGLYPESLPGVAAAAIAVNAQVVADLATPGRVKTIPGTTGTYIVIGRSRFTVAGAGDPVSIQHCVPYAVAVP